MLSNEIVDYLVDETIKINKMRNPELKEKIVKIKSVKVVIISSGLKVTSEYSLDQLAYTIYENFLTDDQRNIMTLQEFRDEFDRYTECCIMSANFRDDLKKITNNIKQGKMFDKGGEVIEHKDDEPEEIESAFVPEEPLNKIEEIESTEKLKSESEEDGFPPFESETAVDTFPVPKKRGRKKKVVDEDMESEGENNE